MNQQTPKCLRCDKEMVEGFIPDFWHGGSLRQPTWVPGAPVKAWWKGLSLPELQLPVRTMRCPQCGCLESFANA